MRSIINATRREQRHGSDRKWLCKRLFSFHFRRTAFRTTFTFQTEIKHMYLNRNIQSSTSSYGHHLQFYQVDNPLIQKNTISRLVRGLTYGSPNWLTDYLRSIHQRLSDPVRYTDISCSNTVLVFFFFQITWHQNFVKPRCWFTLAHLFGKC